MRFEARVFYRPLEEELRYLPECPRVLRNFPSGNPVLGWVTIQLGKTSTTGRINVLDLKSLENTSHELPGRPGFFEETDRPGVVVVGLERRLVLYDLVRREVTDLGCQVSSDERVMINDGLAVPGGLIFGTKHVEVKEPLAALYHYDGETKKLTVLRDCQTCSNGKFFFRHNLQDLLADIDTPTKTLVLYRASLNPPSVDEPAVLADFRDLPEFPDGLRPTPDGRSAVIAFYDPRATNHGIARQVSLQTGLVEAEWLVPGSPRVTCPEFVKIDGRIQLVLTTALEGMPDEIRAMAPEAGSLFIAETQFHDLPEGPPFFEVR